MYNVDGPDTNVIICVALYKFQVKILILKSLVS